MESAILANVIRGETVESIHRGHFFVIDGEGRHVASAGDPNTVTYLRSAAKPFQALPSITTGAADAFGFSSDEIALSSASHSGEAVHTATASQMLRKAGLTEADLRCGAHLPFYEKEAERMLRANEEPTQLHNNCSGKHAAMLATAKHIGADLKTYEDIGHPVQQAALAATALFSDFPVEEIKLGIDGCAAPNFALPIAAMAKSFLNLVNPPEIFDADVRSAAQRIVAAMIEFPFLIGGSERLDTMLMTAANGQIISKVGADGVWLCGVLPSAKWPTGLGIALKIEDGDDKRGRPVVAVEILRQLGVLTNSDLPEVSPMPLKNRRGDVVGRVEPAPILNVTEKGGF